MRDWVPALAVVSLIKKKKRVNRLKNVVPVFRIGLQNQLK